MGRGVRRGRLRLDLLLDTMYVCLYSKREKRKRNEREGLGGERTGASHESHELARPGLEFRV